VRQPVQCDADNNLSYAVHTLTNRSKAHRVRDRCYAHYSMGVNRSGDDLRGGGLLLFRTRSPLLERARV
jgi:hypothetical protein